MHLVSHKMSGDIETPEYMGIEPYHGGIEKSVYTYVDPDSVTSPSGESSMYLTPPGETDRNYTKKVPVVTPPPPPPARLQRDEQKAPTWQGFFKVWAWRVALCVILAILIIVLCVYFFAVRKPDQSNTGDAGTEGDSTGNSNANGYQNSTTSRGNEEIAVNCSQEANRPDALAIPTVTGGTPYYSCTTCLRGQAEVHVIIQNNKGDDSEYLPIYVKPYRKGKPPSRPIILVIISNGGNKYKSWRVDVDSEISISKVYLFNQQSYPEDDLTSDSPFLYERTRRHESVPYEPPGLDTIRQLSFLEDLEYVTSYTGVTEASQWTLRVGVDEICQNVPIVNVPECVIKKVSTSSFAVPVTNGERYSCEPCQVGDTELHALLMQKDAREYSWYDPVPTKVHIQAFSGDQPPTKPITLVLGSDHGVQWDIKVDEGITIQRVILVSNYLTDSNVLVTGLSFPVERVNLYISYYISNWRVLYRQDVTGLDYVTSITGIQQTAEWTLNVGAQGRCQTG